MGSVSKKWYMCWMGSVGLSWSFSIFEYLSVILHSGCSSEILLQVGVRSQVKDSTLRGVISLSMFPSTSWPKLCSSTTGQYASCRPGTLNTHQAEPSAKPKTVAHRLGPTRYGGQKLLAVAFLSRRGPQQVYQSGLADVDVGVMFQVSSRKEHASPPLPTKANTEPLPTQSKRKPPGVAWNWSYFFGPIMQYAS